MTRRENTTDRHPRGSGDPVTTAAGRSHAAGPKAGRETRWRPGFSRHGLTPRRHRLLGPRFRGDDSWGFAAAATATLLGASTAHAAGPENWQVGFSAPGSEIESLIIRLHDHIIAIGAVIVLIVLAILLFVAWRYRASRHPEASRVARAPLLEFGWTVLPIIILGVIAVPSLAVLRFEADIPQAGPDRQGDRLPVVLALRISRL